MSFSQVATVCTSGALFGVGMQKGVVYSPKMALETMLLEELGLLKIFLGCVTGSLFSLTALKVVGKLLKNEYVLTCVEEAKQSHRTHRGLVLVALGSIMEGASLGLGGCAAPLFSGIGAGVLVPFFSMTAAGGLVGTFAYALISDRVEESKWFSWKVATEENSLHGMLGVSWETAATAVGALCVAGLCGLERISPTGYRPDLGYSLWNTNWPYWYCGCWIGAGNLVTALGIQRLMGPSTAYDTILAAVLASTGWSRSWVRRKATATFQSAYWRFVFLGSMMAGGFLSSYLSGTNGWVHTQSPVIPKSPSLAMGFFGGFVSLFGARMADGCASGHGVSGFSTLYCDSLLMAPCFFGTGMALSMSLRTFLPHMISWRL
eukprot:Lithocolla_globosa_v1_NODE_260_length_4772_cov_3.217087.p1 type:complete len:376 gc:universal NODE_260_length_4772_cov_3.217087:4496-3369(-)